MIKTQATPFCIFIINIIKPLQTYVTLLCNILDMRAANSDGSRLRCPRRGEAKKEEDSKPSLSSKKVLSEKKKMCIQEEARKKGRGFQTIVVVEKRFYRRKKMCMQEEARKNEKRIPSHRCRRRKVLSEKKTVLLC